MFDCGSNWYQIDIDVYSDTEKKKTLLPDSYIKTYEDNTNLVMLTKRVYKFKI